MLRRDAKTLLQPSGDATLPKIDAVDMGRSVEKHRQHGRMIASRNPPALEMVDRPPTKHRADEEATNDLGALPARVRRGPRTSKKPSAAMANQRLRDIRRLGERDSVEVVAIAEGMFERGDVKKLKDERERRGRGHMHRSGETELM